MNHYFKSLQEHLPTGWVEQDDNVDGGWLISPQGSIFMMMETMMDHENNNDGAVKAFITISRILEVAKQNGFTKNIESILSEGKEDAWEDLFDFIGEMYEFAGSKAVENAMAAATGMKPETHHRN